MPVTKAGRASLGQKRMSLIGHRLWQRMRQAVSGGGGGGDICFLQQPSAASGVGSRGTRWGSRQRSGQQELAGWSGGWARDLRDGRG